MGMTGVSKKPLPPGSFGLPIVGEALSYSRNPHRFFESRFDRYGPVFKTRLLAERVVCFVGPEAFTFLASQPYFDRAGAPPAQIQALLNHSSLPLIGGEDHHRMRGAVLHAFGPDATEKYLTIIERITLAYLERWEEMVTFSWKLEFKRLSASICDALLLGSEPPLDTARFSHRLDSFVAGLIALPVNLPWTKFGRAVRSRDCLLQLIDRAIEGHREHARDDMLTELMNARTDDGSHLTEEQLRSQVLHMHFAAYGGISRVLTLMAKDMAENPGVMSRAREEASIHAVDGPLDLAGLTKLTYLAQVTREVRRHNRIFATTFLERVTHPFEFEGYRVPAGWKAIGGIFTTMQDRSVFKEPQRFDPDRFGPDRAEGQDSENAYVPQGGGAMEGHRCPAEDLTTILMQAVGLLLLRSHTWELLPQDLTLDSEPRLFQEMDSESGSCGGRRTRWSERSPAERFRGATASSGTPAGPLLPERRCSCRRHDRYCCSR